jgi:hypothetical protein
MAKRPFKKYNSRGSVDAVLVTKQNVEELAELLGGEFIKEGYGGPLDALILPGIPSALEANPGDYVTISGNGRYNVIRGDDFEAAYRVPKPGTDDEEEGEDEE